MENRIITQALEDFSNIELTENYVAKKYMKNFNSHLTGLVDASINFHGSESILKNRDVFITDDLYWQIEADVLEHIDDVTDEDILCALDNLEDSIREKIKSNLGTFYSPSDLDLGKIIDYSVNKCILAVKFDFMSNTSSISNPWEVSKDILTDHRILHSFSNDLEYIKDLGVKLKPLSDSDEIMKYTLGIVSRGKRDSYSGGYVRDFIGLRNIILNYFEEQNCTSSRPIKLERIIEIVQSMGLSELTENEIKNWLIYPLKRSSKIGSNREGYFLLKDCDDILASYASHYENLRGYLRTLENHKKLASQKGCEADERFNRHRNLLSRL